MSMKQPEQIYFRQEYYARIKQKEEINQRKMVRND